MKGVVLGLPCFLGQWVKGNFGL